MIHVLLEATFQVCCSFYFFLFQRYYEKVGIDCSICLIFISQQTAYIGHEAEIFFSLHQGNLKRIKEVMSM